MVTLKQFESGEPDNDLCRQIRISPVTFYKWRGKYSGLDAFTKCMDKRSMTA